MILMKPHFSKKYPVRKNRRAFSLVELLTVLAIISLLVFISFPAVEGIRSTYNRKAATEMVMQAVQNARMSALQSGENVSVIFALATDNGVSPDALIVAGDQPLGSPASGPVRYTKWMRLPTGIRFRSSPGTLPTNPLLSSTDITPDQLPAIPGSPTYYAITFNANGTLSSPAPGNGNGEGGLEIALYEGTRNGAAETALGASAKATQNLSDSGIYDVVRLDRYSGRSWMEVSTLAEK
jgi:prepilin-type N-terminal cleavage/methylation domain-containing protein